MRAMPLGCQRPHSGGRTRQWNPRLRPHRSRCQGPRVSSWSNPRKRICRCAPPQSRCWWGPLLLWVLVFGAGDPSTVWSRTPSLDLCLMQPAKAHNSVWQYPMPKDALERLTTPPPPDPPHQSDHRGKQCTLQSGKSGGAIFGAHTSPPPPLSSPNTSLPQPPSLHNSVENGPTHSDAQRQFGAMVLSQPGMALMMVFCGPEKQSSCDASPEVSQGNS